MNIGFYDPITERWIKPRPDPEPIPPPNVSMGEALLNAVAAKAEQERCAKIWEYLKQSAQGCNDVPAGKSEPTPIVTTEPAEYVEPRDPVMIMQERLIFMQAGPTTIEWTVDGSSEVWNRIEPEVVCETQSQFEPVESLGYVYWKPKVTI